MIMKARSPVAEGDITKQIKTLQFIAETDGDLSFLRDLFAVLLHATDDIKRYVYTRKMKLEYEKKPKDNTACGS